MRPYVLNYSEVIKVGKSDFMFDEAKQINQLLQADVTTQTFTLECEDDDGVTLSHSTLITERVENSDEDYLCSSQSTLETRVIESSDDDDFSSSCERMPLFHGNSLLNLMLSNGFGLTLTTETIEPSDQDELHVISGTTLITKVVESSDDEYSPH